MIYCFDRPSWLAALALPLDAELHALLPARHRYLATEGLEALTDTIVVLADTTNDEIEAALGWHPTRDVDGRRSDEPGFVQPFDLAWQASAHFMVAVQIVGNAGHAFEIVIRDDANPALLAVAREVAE